ncbi:hypothetical protein [Modicisalibacter sp. MOD 31.J]|uniref:hypothetical protein n=1 Tax=Modicisalibacter sp. MOD 31.J TaxID=2831897 RepID=UPI001CCEA03C|nr:hypothetical protein [Modicisalibacter sp. MOD 31.J]MBZ9574525.1 hypothetical protein [Modicisalibacter sp. MOD 31.J]
MPDFERVTRTLERDLVADDPVKSAYVQGKHDGIDKARKEIALTAIALAVTALIVVAIAFKH